MKKLATLAIVVGLGLASTSAMAGIKNTKHDLSIGSTNMTGMTAGTGSNQLCIYCHTPHNASPSIPLWNRTNAGATTYQFYSSPSMKLHQGSRNTFETTSTSLMCMSCHNGIDGLADAITNKSGAVALAGTNSSGNIVGDVISTGNAKLGTDLRNDHPVNIKMVASTAGLNDPIAGTNTIGTGLITKLPLFKGTAGGDYIECGSCHSVHDNTNLKFLRTSNKGSILCLACHAK